MPAGAELGRRGAHDGWCEYLRAADCLGTFLACTEAWAFAEALTDSATDRRKPKPNAHYLPPSPAADVGGLSPLMVQMWAG